MTSTERVATTGPEQPPRWSRAMSPGSPPFQSLGAGEGERNGVFLPPGGCWGDGGDPQTHSAVLAPWPPRILIKAANEAAPQPQCPPRLGASQSRAQGGSGTGGLLGSNASKGKGGAGLNGGATHQIRAQADRRPSGGQAGPESLDLLGPPLEERLNGPVVCAPPMDTRCKGRVGGCGVGGFPYNTHVSSCAGRQTGD